jgi:hypothetical protein
MRMTVPVVERKVQLSAVPRSVAARAGPSHGAARSLTSVMMTL